MTTIAGICRYDQIERGDHFYIDLAKGEVAIADSIYALPTGKMRIKFHRGDGSMGISAFEPHHLTAVLQKLPKADLKHLLAINAVMKT